MRLLVVNPNRTASMTAKIGAAARRAAAPGTAVTTTQADDAPPSIEGYFDGALSVPGLLAAIMAGERQRFDAHVIACFDDTGLDAARSAAAAPVIGIGEAAYHVATLISGRFTVVTTLPRSVPVLEGNLVRCGLAGRCARVRAADVPVLGLEDPRSPARDKVSAEIAAALREDRAEAIVLGCAGMADLAASLSAEHGVPVVEGVAAAVRLAECVAGLGLATSKLGGWAAPIAKPYGRHFRELADGAALP
jgi:allantoin racemase